MSNITIHGVKAYAFGETFVTDNGVAFRHLKIESRDGSDTITLFADSEEKLVTRFSSDTSPVFVEVETGGDPIPKKEQRLCNEIQGT